MPSEFQKDIEELKLRQEADAKELKAAADRMSRRIGEVTSENRSQGLQIKWLSDRVTAMVRKEKEQ